jgi:hypothetical protein
MTITIKPEWWDYITEKYDDDGMKLVVSQSKTPAKILKEMRALDYGALDVDGEHLFTFVE